MNNLQIQYKLYDIFRDFRPTASFPTYPPYHKGDYFEEYFCKQYLENFLDLDIECLYLPIYWTNCYNGYYDSDKLQFLINNLDKNYVYFTVSMHDDAPREKFSSKVLQFSGGGLSGNIALPLICSPLEYDFEGSKDIFCSFVGSITHPIRQKLSQHYSDNEKYYFSSTRWNSVVEKDREELFKNITARSKFALCPRGYGPTSYRTYECLQLGTIPVYVYDKKWLPYEDSTRWDEFSISIHESQISKIDDILTAYSDSDVKKMSENAKSASKNFIFSETYSRIVNYVKTH